MSETYTVYIISNKNHTVYYTGVTHDIVKRITEHKQGLFEGFSKKYNCNQLLYFEVWYERDGAYLREKQLKRYRRIWKKNLISQQNSTWRDLSDDFLI